MTKSKRNSLVTLAALAFLLLAPCSFGQTPVVLSPVPKLQFLDASGRPLASGCLFSFISGTTNPLDTFTDSTGVSVNSNPVILDSGGFAGSGSSGVWLQAGQAYRLSVKSFGGTNCASGSTLYSVDGIGGGTTTLTNNVPYGPTPSFPIQAQNELFTILLTGDAVGQTLTAVGILPPAFIVFQITQDSAGGHSFTWPSNVIGGAQIGLNANQVTTQMFVWNGTNATAIGPAVTGNGPAISTGDIAVLGNVVASGAFFGTSFRSGCANPASVGVIRLCAGESVNWRNVANSADYGIASNASNDVGIWGFAGGLETIGTVPDIFLGGMTASFPRLKRNGATLAFRLGDDSADAAITALRLDTSGTYAVRGAVVSDPGAAPASTMLGYFKTGSGFCAEDSTSNVYCTGLAAHVIQAVKKTAATCTVAGGTSYETCSDTLTWPTAFPDTAYVASCTGRDPNAVGTGVGNQSELLIIQGYTTTTIQVITQQNRGGGTDANFTEIHCIGVEP